MGGRGAPPHLQTLTFEVLFPAFNCSSLGAASSRHTCSNGRANYNQQVVDIVATMVGVIIMVVVVVVVVVGGGGV